MESQLTCWMLNRRKLREILWRQWEQSNWEFLMTSTGACLTKILMITLRKFKRQLKSSSNSKCRRGESTMRRQLMKKLRVSKCIWQEKKYLTGNVRCKICMKVRKRRQRDWLRSRRRKRLTSRSARISIKSEGTKFSSISKRRTSRNCSHAKSIWNSYTESMEEAKNSSRHC